MRTILVVLFLFFYFLFSIPVLGIEYLLAKKHKRAVDLHRLHSVQWALRMIMFFSGTKMVVKGHENVPTDEPVLYIGNHRSFFDIITTYSICPDLTGYIAKDSLNKVPILGWIMRRAYCLFLVRDDPKQSIRVIQTATEYVKQGVSISIYPEGGRNRDDGREDSLLPFKDGSFKIAARTGCPIVPMATIGSADVLEKHFPWIHSRTVTVIYGKPVRLQELEKEVQKKPGAYFRGLVQELIAEEYREREQSGRG